eukprot:352209-Hanusia_phi.AAC.7
MVASLTRIDLEHASLSLVAPCDWILRPAGLGVWSMPAAALETDSASDDENLENIPSRDEQREAWESVINSWRDLVHSPMGLQMQQEHQGKEHRVGDVW